MRGGRLDPEVLRDDAERYHAIYSEFGISVFATRGITVDELAQQPPLVASRSSRSCGSAFSAPLVSGWSRHVATRATSPWRSTTSKRVSLGLRPVSTTDGPTRTMRTEHASPGAGMDIDLTADLNAQDDDGLGWSTVADAHDPARVVPGAMLLAGNRFGQAVVRIVAVDDDGQVHFAILPGSVEKNRHLLGRTVA